MVMFVLVAIQVTVEIVHVVVVPVKLLAQHNIKVAAVDARGELSRDLDLKSINIQARKCLAQPLLASTQVEQGTHDHVAADTARTLKIERLSHLYSPSPRAPRTLT